MSPSSLGIIFLSLHSFFYSKTSLICLFITLHQLTTEEPFLTQGLEKTSQRCYHSPFWLTQALTFLFLSILIPRLSFYASITHLSFPCSHKEELVKQTDKTRNSVISCLLQTFSSLASNFSKLSKINQVQTTSLFPHSNQKCLLAKQHFKISSFKHHTSFLCEAHSPHSLAETWPEHLPWRKMKNEMAVS